MKRITIRAPEETFERLRLIATEQGASLATQIRETLEEYAAKHQSKA